MIYIDTHIAVWTFLGQTRRLSAASKKAIAAGPVWYSPMVRMELNILHERRKLPAESPALVIADLARDFDAQEHDGPFSAVVTIAETLRWTTDPFDRLIVATAMADDAKLVSADGDIIQHFSGAVW